MTKGCDLGQKRNTETEYFFREWRKKFFIEARTFFHTVQLAFEGDEKHLIFTAHVIHQFIKEQISYICIVPKEGVIIYRSIGFSEQPISGVGDIVW